MLAELHTRGRSATAAAIALASGVVAPSEMHQQRRLWVTLRHEQENAVFSECPSSCVMRAAIASNRLRRILPLFGEYAIALRRRKHRMRSSEACWSRGCDDVAPPDVGSAAVAVAVEMLLPSTVARSWASIHWRRWRPEILPTSGMSRPWAAPRQRPLHSRWSVAVPDGRGAIRACGARRSR